MNSRKYLLYIAYRDDESEEEAEEDEIKQRNLKTNQAEEESDAGEIHNILSQFGKERPKSKSREDNSDSSDFEGIRSKKSSK